MTRTEIYGLTDADKFVYHYTRASTLIEHILPTNTILFSRFQRVNDPRESKDWEFGFHSSKWDLDADIESIKAVFNRHLKHDWHIGCFVSDVIEGVTTKAREDAGGDMLSALYERGHSRPRMWAQYGDGFKGACLIFDRSKLAVAVRKATGKDALIHGARVKYQNPPVGLNLRRADSLMINFDQVMQMGVEEAAKLHTRNHFSEILFVKARDWEAEREFRWAVNEPTLDELYINISDSLIGIVVGDLCTNEFKRAVGQYAINRDIEVVQMRWRNGVPQPEISHPRLFADASQK